MEERPGLNDLIVLRDRDGREYRTRVEGLGPDLLTVAAPFDLPSGGDFSPGVEMLITWSTGRGISVLPARLDAVHPERSLPVWSLAVTGVGWVEQRRNFVRVPAHGPVTLRLGRDEGEVVDLAGNLVDISEGALRCAVTAAAAADVADGAEVSAAFRFGDLGFAVPARIHSRRAGAHAGLTELVVLFNFPKNEGDALRKQIFAQQRRAYRTKSDGWASS